MIVRLKIEDSHIVSAICFQNGNDKTGTPMVFSDFEFQWGKKWQVILTGFGIECTSVRSSRTGGLNIITYTINHNGIEQTSLSDDGRTRIIKIARVFRRSGYFDGILSLVYNKNNHRFAEFISAEYPAFMKQHQLSWIRKIDMSDFELGISRKNIITFFKDADDGCSLCRTVRRELITDGRMLVSAEDHHIIIRLENASWAVLIKYHPVSMKTERVLFTKCRFLDLEEMPSFISCMGNHVSCFYTNPEK